jgi:hypothetical protein
VIIQQMKKLGQNEVDSEVNLSRGSKGLLKNLFIDSLFNEKGGDVDMVEGQFNSSQLYAAMLLITLQGICLL